MYIYTHIHSDTCTRMYAHVYRQNTQTYTCVYIYTQCTHILRHTCTPYTHVYTRIHANTGMHTLIEKSDHQH